MTSTSRLTLREWPPWCSKLCRCENAVTRWGICLQSWAEILYYHCDGNCAGSSISDQNWNCEAAASKVTLPRFSLQMNQRMNEHQSLLFCSLPACPLLILSFQVFAFEKKSFSTTLHVLALKFQGTWMVPSDDPFLRKQTSEKALKPNSNDSNISYIFVKSFWISLPINAKKNLLQHLFSCEAYLWSSIWSLTVEVSFIFIDLCRFSIVDVPPSGPENVPKPGLPPYRSPLSAVSSTCKEITCDKRYGSVCLALFTASLTKKCSLKLCTRQMDANGNVFTMRQDETSVTRSTWIQAKATLTSEVS